MISVWQLQRQQGPKVLKSYVKHKISAELRLTKTAIRQSQDETHIMWRLSEDGDIKTRVSGRIETRHVSRDSITV